MPCSSAREVTNPELEVCLLLTQHSALCESGVIVPAIGPSADWTGYFGRTRDAMSVTITSVAMPRSNIWQ
jgi:hypothetical protein